MPTFSERLSLSEPLLGAIVTSHDPSVTEALSHSGLDWLFFDTEHAPLASGDLHNLVRAAGKRCGTLVRIRSKLDEADVKQALDNGCDGIIVPAVSSAGDVTNVLRWAKYAPLGARSVGVGRAHTFGLGFADYIENANRNTSVIIQIENKEAVDAIDSITDIEGISGIFIGPYDLSASLGHIGDVAHPDVLNAIRRVKETALRKKVPLGIFSPSPEGAILAIEDGFKFVVVGIDIGMMLGAVTSLTSRIKAS